MPPRLAIVSTGIRRDLLAPLYYFKQFELVHLYRHAEYGDLTPEDLTANLIRYNSPFDLFRLLVRVQPEVIQGVEPFSVALQPYLWACWRAADDCRARLLAVTLENRPLEIKFGRPLALILRGILLRYFSRACLVITLNNGAVQNVAKCGVDRRKIEKMMWGTWGVDLEDFFPPVPGENASSSSGRGHETTILYAGRLHEEKGIFVLLEAFAIIAARLPAVRLLVVGDGPAAGQLQARVEALGVSGLVQLAGTVKNRAMPDVFRSADVFAAPSLTTRKWEEQVGMSAIQAMACGLPVVASRSGAIPEYVPDGIAGILVPEGDATSLAESLLQLLTNNQRREQMGLAAREYACEHYDAQVNVQHAENILKERCIAGRV